MLRIASLCSLSLLLGLALLGAARPLCAQQAPPTLPPATQDTLDWKNSFTIPLVYDPLLSPYAVVYVSINEQEPLPFLLDTGANVSLAFTPQAAKTLHLLPTGETVLTNSKVKTLVFRMSSIRFPLAGDTSHSGMMPFSNAKSIRTYVLNLIPGATLPDGKPLAGVVGVGLWRNTTIRLDFAAKMMNVYINPHLPLHLPDTTMLPLKAQDTGLYSVTLPLNAKQMYDFLLDTGCDVTQAPPAVVQALHVRVTPIASVQSLVGGLQQSDVGLLPSLSLGTFTPENVGVAYPDNDKASGKAILGMNVLSRYRLVLDFPNKQLHLQRAANYADVAHGLGYPVIHLGRKGTQIHVNSVVVGSAAYRAGVRKGDVLLSIDDVPMQGLIETAVQTLINGYGNTQAHLQVQQEGETKTITYHRYSLWVLSAPIDVGLDLHVSAVGQLFVDGAEKDFPAYKAGIRKGDEILAIDGKPVQATDYEALLDTLNNSKINPLPVTILRKGETEPRQVLLDRQ